MPLLALQEVRSAAWQITVAFFDRYLHGLGRLAVGNEQILEGDTMAKVLRVAGEPDMRSRIESDEGGTVGNRWYYVIEGYNAKTIIITFQGGRVVDIRRERI